MRYQQTIHNEESSPKKHSKSSALVPLLTTSQINSFSESPANRLRSISVCASLWLRDTTRNSIHFTNASSLSLLRIHRSTKGRMDEENSLAGFVAISARRAIETTFHNSENDPSFALVIPSNTFPPTPSNTQKGFCCAICASAAKSPTSTSSVAIPGNFGFSTWSHFASNQTAGILSNTRSPKGASFSSSKTRGNSSSREPITSFPAKIAAKTTSSNLSFRACFCNSLQGVSSRMESVSRSHFPHQIVSRDASERRTAGMNSGLATCANTSSPTGIDRFWQSNRMVAASA